MSQPTILLVEDEPAVASRIRTAIATHFYSAVAHVTSGESAVLWVGANSCDLCLLDYGLPGINGLETLVRIQQRRPDLPVIMLSDAASEHIAVAAFRAKVADFVPKEAGFERIVAQRSQQIVGHAARYSDASASTTGPAIPDDLLRPTYQNRLRLIGRELDHSGYRGVTILEVAGGFLARGTQSGSRSPEALEFPDQNFLQLVQSAFAARGEGERKRASSLLLPTGYEDFLRALGYRLDTHMAAAVSVTELEGFVAVGGVAKVEASEQTNVGPLQWLMRADDIAYLLDEAFRRRVVVQEPKKAFRFPRAAT